MHFGFVPDFEAEEFDVFRSVSWTHLIFFSILETILVGKCIVAKLHQVIVARDRLISIEVLSTEKSIDLKRAKRNLS